MYGYSVGYLNPTLANTGTIAIQPHTFGRELKFHFQHMFIRVGGPKPQI